MADEFTEKMLQADTDALQKKLQNKSGRSAYVIAIVIDEGAGAGCLKSQGGIVSRSVALSFAEQLERKAREIRNA